MKIAIVGPSPVPFTFGGVESLLGSLRDQIASLTSHHAELIKLPTREKSFWELIESYDQFLALDLSHFDLVISTKYPAWMVRHPHHVCYMTHRLRGLYDTYHLTGEPLEVLSGISLVDRLLQFMDRHASSSADVMPEFFHLLGRLREAQSEVPQKLLKFPGPLIRRIVHFLDDHALSPGRIRRFFAISATVARRPAYFPSGVEVQVVHPPSHLSAFRDTGARYLFTTGRLDGPKRIDLLVRAMGLVKAPLPLKIAGTGPEEGALRKLARGDGRIEFLGFVRDEALVELYGEALAVLYIPYEEDYGLVTIEAMMSRKPVITCTDSGGPLEFVGEGTTGFIASPDPAALAEKIQRLAVDAVHARAMGQKGYERVRHITWERAIGTLLQGRTDPPSQGFFARTDTLPAVSRRAPSTVSPARPKLVVATTFPIYPPVSGGRLRAFQLYQRVARLFEVEAVCLVEAGAPPFEGEIAAGFREIRVPKSRRHEEEEARLSQSVHGVPITDIAMALWHSLTPAYLDCLAASIRDAEIVVACHPYCFPVIRQCREKQRLVYEAQDVEYPLKANVLGRGDASRDRLLDVVKEVEGETSRGSDVILACSVEDKAELLTLYGIESGKVLVVPNGVDVKTIRFVSPSKKDRLKAEFGLAGQRIALFVGSWHPPNLEAAEVIFEMSQRLPHVKFLLVGSQALPLARRRRLNNVGLFGIVDDETLAVLLALADVALNPMRGGSGSNLKIGTYLAAGVPVVTTPMGARGYDLNDGEHALICPVEEFPEKITQIVNDRALAQGLARRGRRLVEERYNWGGIGADAAAALRSLLNLPPQDTHILWHLIDEVSWEVAELGVPEDSVLVRRIAEGFLDFRPSEALGRG